MVRLSLGVLGCALVLGLASCKIPAGSFLLPGSTAPPSVAASEIVRFAAVGDSLTAGTAPGSLLTSAPTRTSWVYFLNAVSEFSYAGGWARGGATSTDDASNVGPVVADVLIILTGTNNLIPGIPFEQQTADIDKIAATIRAPRVLILALPPFDLLPDPTVVSVRNQELEGLAEARGWEFLDPWVEFREGDLWIPAATSDGVHPTLSTHEAVADRIGRYLAR